MNRAFHRGWIGLFATMVLPIWSTGVLAEDITVSYASLGAAYMDHVVAIEKGYALEEGLNIRVLKSGGGSATQVLLSGQIHFSSSAGSALSAALRGGPVKIIYTNQSRPTYKLLSNKPEIKTLQDLIGKKIAINTFGDTGHLATLLLFKKYRLDPKLFLFIAVRSEARFPAFLSGAIDAAPLCRTNCLGTIPRWSSGSCAHWRRGGNSRAAIKSRRSRWCPNTLPSRRTLCWSI